MRPARLLPVLFIMLVASTAMARIWTDKYGNTVNAKFVRFFEGDVVLQPGAKVIKIPFEDLGREDRAYVRKLLEEQGQADLLPPEEPEKEIELRLPGPGPKRTWTDVDGREIQAQIVGVKKDCVLLLFKGKEVAVPLERLSPEDRRYVEQEKERALSALGGTSGDRAARPTVGSAPRMPAQPQPHFPGPPNIPRHPSFEGPRPSVSPSC